MKNKVCVVKSPAYSEIESLKIKIIDATLLLGTVFGIITFFIALQSYHDSDIKFNYLLDLLTIIAFAFVFTFRKRISLRIKSVIVLIGIFQLVFVDLYKLGLFSDNKILLIIIPFFSFLIFNIRYSLVIFALAIGMYIIIAISYSSGYLTSAIDFEARSTNLNPWILNLLLITVVSFIVVLVLWQFILAFNKLIANLKKQNIELKNYREELERLVAERTNDLKYANEELKDTNRVLYETSQLVHTQNTELKSTMKNLQETQAHMIESEKMASLGVLTAGVAHEINNPLNYIMGGYLGLENYFSKSNAGKKEEIEVLMGGIKTGLKRASDIVKSLNQFNRNTDVLSENCDLHAIIENCLSMLYGQYKNKVSIEKVYAPESISIQGNVGKLHQVFVNLITNSIHAIESKGKGTISIATQHDAKFAYIEITDTGQGISKNILNRITEPFFTTKDPGKGTGLGLSISYKIIQEHCGTMTFSSVIGEGTRVTVKLPINGKK